MVGGRAPLWSSEGGARGGPLFSYIIKNSLKTRLKYIKITLKDYHNKSGTVPHSVFSEGGQNFFCALARVFNKSPYFSAYVEIYPPPGKKPVSAPAGAECSMLLEWFFILFSKNWFLVVYLFILLNQPEKLK